MADHAGNNRTVSTVDPGSNNIHAKDDLQREAALQRNSYSDSPLHAGGGGINSQSKLAQLAQEDAMRMTGSGAGGGGAAQGGPQSTIQEI